MAAINYDFDDLVCGGAMKATPQRAHAHGISIAGRAASEWRFSCGE